MSWLRSFRTLHRLLGPFRAHYGWLLFLQSIPTAWSLVTFLAASTVIEGVAQSSTVLTSSGGTGGPLSGILAGYTPEQSLMIGICLAAASVFLGTVTGLVLHQLDIRFLDKLIVHLQSLCMENLLAYRLLYHDRTKRGDLIQLVTAETRNCRNVIKHSFSTFSALVTFVIYALVILYISWPLTLAYLFVCGLALIFTRVLGRMNLKFSAQALEQRSATLSVVQEGLFGVRPIKSLLQGPPVIQRMAEHSFASNTAFSHSSTMQHLQAMVMELFGLISIAVVMILSFRMPSLISSSQALLFLYVARQMLAASGALVRAHGLFLSNMPSITVVEDFLSLGPTEREKDGTREKLTLLEDSLVFEKVELAYEAEKVILRGVDLEIRRGERIGIVGPSGAGKSTLAHLLLRFYDATGGRITIDDIPIEELRLEFLRRHIGLLSQEGFVFNTTVLENIQMGRPGAPMDEVIAAARRAHAHEFIEQLAQGYDTVVGDRGVRLSGGQRQRLNIAQVFLKDPEILILDEATSALDSESEVKVQEAIQSLSRNRTVLMIAHRLSTLKDADRIVVIEGGRIVEQGAWEELIRAQGRFAQAWELQAGSFQTVPAGAVES